MRKLKEFDVGTIVNISSDGTTFDLEFVNDKGKTYAFKTVQIVDPTEPYPKGKGDWEKDFDAFWTDIEVVEYPKEALEDIKIFFRELLIAEYERGYIDAINWSVNLLRGRKKPEPDDEGGKI